MKQFVKELVNEHKELVARIKKVEHLVYGDDKGFNKVEFANLAIQLSAMKKYEECLSARLANHDVISPEEGRYFEEVQTENEDNPEK